MAYIVNPVTFDGTNDNLLRGGGLTGAVDGSNATVSFWLHRNIISTNQVIYSSQASRIEASINTSNLMTVAFLTSGGTITLRFQTAITDTTNWHHFILSGNGTNGHAYIDGVSVTPNVVVAGNVAWVRTNWSVGSSLTSTFRLSGDLADLWLDDVYIDLSIAANREKFRSASGAPVDLGSTGAIPTGSQPLLFLSGLTASWHTNKGTGGGFTLTGALTDGSLPLPIDVTTVTLTTSLEAVALRQALLATVSFDAAAQRRIEAQITFEAVGALLATIQTTLTAAAQKAVTISAVMDAVGEAIIIAGELSTILDAMAQRQLSLTADLAAAGQLNRSFQTSLEAAAQQAFTVTTALEALARVTQVQTTSFEAAGQAAHTISTSLDALSIVIGATAIMAAFEAVGRGTRTVSSSLEAASQVLRSTTASFHATSQIGREITATLNAISRSSIQLTAIFDAAAQKRLTVTATLDARAVLFKTIIANLDAVARQAAAVNATLEAAARATFTATMTLESAAQRPFAIQAQLDSVAARSGLASIDLNALALLQGVVVTATFDAIVGDLKTADRRVIGIESRPGTVLVPASRGRVVVRVPTVTVH